jgi:hypothetical protein
MERDRDVPIELVALKIGYKVRHELTQVLCAVAVRHNDRESLIVTLCHVRGVKGYHLPLPV